MMSSARASSSDSASEARPRVPWLSTWTVTCALLVLVLAAGEFTWRILGYPPSAVDSPALWKFWYERALSGGPRTIVLIGASRLQSGISTPQMRRRLPGFRVVQLGQYAGGSPIGVLRTFASEDHFNGTVICDTLEPFLIRKNWDDQRDLYEHAAGARERVEAAGSAIFHDVLALKNRTTGINASLNALVNKGCLPPSDHVRMRADRSIELDFSRLENLEGFRAANVEKMHRRYKAAQHPAPQELDDEFAEIDELVRRIQARGGQVVFLRMPSSGARLELEEEFHPKAKYWDRFAKMCRGICIHSSELAGGRELKCPDDSHLDYRDAVRFTNVLIDELLQRGALTMQ